jgi:uncharacterized protein (TIGR00251 family)
MAIEVTESAAAGKKAGTITFRVRVQPRASRDAVGGEWEGALRVRLTAPPVDSRANEALCRLLAKYLNVSTGAVRLLSGERSRTKRVEVAGAAAAQIQTLGSMKP